MDKSMSVNVTSLNESKSYWFWLLCHNEDDAVSEIVNSPDYDATNLTVDIKINGVQVYADAFDTMMGIITSRVVEQLKEDQGLTSLESAAKLQARNFYKRLHGEFSEKMDDLLNQISHLGDLGSTIVQKHWDEPFYNTEKDNILSRASIVNDGKEKHQSFEAHIEGGEYIPEGNGTFSAVGFGANEAEARAALKKVVEALFKVK